MDGSLSKNLPRYPFRRVSWMNTKWFGHRQIVTLCLFIACFSEILAADHPWQFRRSSSNPKNSAPAKAEPTREVTQTRVTVDETVAAKTDSTPNSTPIGDSGIRAESTMQRFPRKSQVGTSAFSRSTNGGINTPIETETLIDLPGALHLSGMRSPQVLLAQQRVLAATAQQQLAAAQALPNLNLGTNYDQHTGALQRASGKIISVERSALYVGAGGNAVAAGTVNLPGLQYNLNVGDSYFDYLVSRQLSERSRAGVQTTQNNVLLQTASAYCNLVRAQGARAIAVRVRDNAAELARITQSFATIGQARPADAERAANELELRQAEIFLHDAAIANASATLVEILNMESSVQLRSNENWIVPRPIVPELIPLSELIAISLYQRPEVAAQRADVHAAMLELKNAKLLVFSPQVIAGLSDGAFGGGSNINAGQTGKPLFGSFGDRTDEDLVLYWSIRNLGLGNRSLIKMATARLAVSNLEQTRQFNEIRAQVAEAYARTLSAAAQLELRQRAVETSERGYRADLQRARAGEGLPIEVLNSLMLSSRAQVAYLNTIADYNQAHYELYVAIGQPPADLLVRSVDSPAVADVSATDSADRKTSDQQSQSLKFERTSALSTLESLETIPIDMAGAFALIGVQNPEFLAAQQRVLESDALRQFAAVQLLPTINLGTSLDSHNGPLQQSDGNILTVNRQSLFVGAGASAIAAGTVNIPGVVWNLNVSESAYNYLISRQVQTRRAANVTTVNNDVQNQVAVAYLELVRAGSLRAVAWKAREESAEIARTTSTFARSGQGRPADADRAIAELIFRDGIVIETEGASVRASARLAALIGLDSSVRLTPTDLWAVPHSIVPEPIPLAELLTIALLRRPELSERRADVVGSLLALDSARMLPFSPTVFLGFSAGAFGGGSDLASAPIGTSTFASGQARFGNFQSRTDLDVMAYWTLRNLGVGNKAHIAASSSRVRQSQLQELATMDRIRTEVASAYVRMHARYHQLQTAEEAVRESELAFREDMARIRGNEGRPIEVLDSQRLLFESREALVNTIINYNIAQFELYRALGQPQADLLVRSAFDINVPIGGPEDATTR